MNQIKGDHKPNCLLGLNPKGRVNPDKDAPNFINGAMMHKSPFWGKPSASPLRRAERVFTSVVSPSGHDMLTGIRFFVSSTVRFSIQSSRDRDLFPFTKKGNLSPILINGNVIVHTAMSLIAALCAPHPSLHHDLGQFGALHTTMVSIVQLYNTKPFTLPGRDTSKVDGHATW